MGKTQKKINAPIAKNIKLRRSALGWTQEDLSHKSGVSITSLKDIERMTAEGHIDTRVAIANALGCTLSDLYKTDRSKTDLTLALAASVLETLRDTTPLHRGLVLGLLFRDAAFFRDLPDGLVQSVQALIKAR